MKKIFLILICLTMAFISQAQNSDNALAVQLVTKNAAAIGLTKDQLGNYKVSSTYYDASTDTRMVYLLQTYKGIQVFNQMYVLAFKKDKLISNAGGFIANIEQRANQSEIPSLSAANAIKKAFTAAKVATPSVGIATNTADNGHKLNFGTLKGVNEDVVAELMWVPVQNSPNNTIKLAWQVQVVPEKGSDWWLMQVDASNGSVINKLNLTVSDRWDKTGSELLRNRVVTNKNAGVIPSFLSFPQTQSQVAEGNSPSLVGTANYLVIPYPAESPHHPGGTAAVVTNPWTAAPNNATTLRWHNDGASDYTISRGNNVWATEDRAGTNTNGGIITPTGLPATSSTSPDPLNFNFPPDYSADPTTTTAAANNFRQFAITNLFYWNNNMHDMSYQYGFNEAAGNFQANNQGRGGNGNDYVIALAESAAEGSIGNNANFSAPADGSRGRMRMYLFNAAGATTTLHVNTPGAIAGNYTAVEGAFSTTNLLGNVGPVTGQVVYFNDDAAGTTHYACGAPDNSLTGKIALINRGSGGSICTSPVNFTVKVKNAQIAGAIAVIVVNNIAGAPIVMGGTLDNTITIPAVMISDVDGATLAAQLANNVNVTLSGSIAVPLDGDLDAGVMCHEYTHGISNRFTGGPANPSCLQNAEEGGEGWSDYMALMMTTNWATATTGDGPLARPMGTYVLGQPTTGTGIRNYPYSTNMTINPLTYANMGAGTIGTEVHNIGEIWCATIWDMTWNIIQQENSINTNLWNFDVNTTTGGNSIALKLVLEGMRLQPCSPGYIDARNAILTADQNLYGGRHYCAIWNAFARRGMGYTASEGSSFSATDQTPKFDLPPAPSITTQPASTAVCAGNNATFTVVATGGNLTYNWQVSTDGGTTWNSVSPANTTASLTLTGVTVAMNNNRYRVVLTAGCAVTTVNSNAAVLTVNNSTVTITTQPTDVSACAGNNATFTVAASGTNTYNWQVSTDGGTTWNNTSPVVTTATLTLTGVTVAMNNNKYRCVVTGGCSGTATATSNAATLTVTTGSITITGQPASTATCVGGTATFNITATGASLTYNWQVSTDGGTTWNNTTPVNTTTTLTINPVTAAMNNNQYRCVVNGPGACSSAGVASSAATLTVNGTTTITVQPTNQGVCTGSNATFCVTATGANLSYQWQISLTGCASPAWVNITLANSNCLTISNVTIAQNNFAYQCVVTGACGTVTTNCATLTVNTPAVITSQPANAVACVSANATFSVTASGTGLSYNWQVSTDGGTTWNNVTPAVTTPTLTLTGVTAAMNNNQYRCVVSIACNPTGVNSNAATLTVNNPVAITGQPANTAACVGTNATFTVTATGTGLSYNWQVSTDGGATWNNVSPAVTTASLTLTAVTAAMNNNQYRAVVSGTCTSPGTNSSAATLTVNNPVVITTQPANATVCPATTATFTVAATGTALTYNWQVSTDGGTTWNNVSPAATTATLTLTNVTTAMNNNRYRVVVSGTCTPAGVNSNGGILTVNSNVAITTQPADAAVCLGTSATFTTAATGTGVAYNWQVSTDGGTTWANVSPANTTGTLTITGTTLAMSGYKYRNAVTGTCNTTAVNTNAATLTVNTSVTIVTQPANLNGCLGNSGTFTVVATGTTITYQWQYSVDGGTTWINIAGATSATLTLNPLTNLMNGWKYRVVVSGVPCGSINSNAATLTVNQNPVVVLTAASNTRINPAVKTIVYTTVSPNDGSYSINYYTYKWFRNGAPISNTSSSFPVDVDNLGTYQVTVTNTVGCSATSNVVSVSDSVSDRLFVFPNPSSGNFQVRYYSSNNATPARTLTIMDAAGKRVYAQSFAAASGPYVSMPVKMANAGSGIYEIELWDASGKKIASGKVVISR